MKHRILPALAVLVVSSSLAVAQAPTGVRGDMLYQFNDAASKITALAQAISADKYAWHPTGARAVSEVFMHVVGSNYYLLTFAGVQPSKQLPRDAEHSIKDKAQIATELQASFEHVRAAISKLSDADLDKPTKMFGEDTNYRNVYLTTVTHMHEHLGQLIAYARSNGVVPPWSN